MMYPQLCRNIQEATHLADSEYKHNTDVLRNGLFFALMPGSFAPVVFLVMFLQSTSYMVIYMQHAKVANTKNLNLVTYSKVLKDINKVINNDVQASQGEEVRIHSLTFIVGQTSTCSMKYMLRLSSFSERAYV